MLIYTIKQTSRGILGKEMPACQEMQVEKERSFYYEKDV